MKTVYDLISHRMTLQVIRRNCDHTGTLNHRFLAARLGIRWRSRASPSFAAAARRGTFD